MTNPDNPDQPPHTTESVDDIDVSAISADDISAAKRIIANADLMIRLARECGFVSLADLIRRDVEIADHIIAIARGRRREARPAHG